jgi:class 3 adenylate cyclase/predicted negative regulator of RcsB-dependent stress response
MKYDPATVDRLLALLRKWDWETGLQKLRTEIELEPDATKRADLQLFTAWQAAERGERDEATQHFHEARAVPALAGWALTGLAFHLLRDKQFTQAHEHLNQAERAADPADAILRATIHHHRGAVLFHEGKNDRALPLLHAALEGFGRDHFGTARVLDTLGMVYAAKDNFAAAREFHQQALDLRPRFHDDAGLAVSHGQLGRLYLDWGNLEKADEHFKADLEIARRIADKHGEAQMYNALGQVALARSDWDAAAAYLDESIRRWQGLHRASGEAYARKDRALAHVGSGDPAAAEAELTGAEQLFQFAGFTEGLGHVNRAWGVLRRVQGQSDESERKLRAAQRHFQEAGECAEVARTQLELARTLRDRPTPRPLVSEAFLAALTSAEACRRAALVRAIEDEWKAEDEPAWCRHVYRRARGRGVREDTTSLIRGSHVPATVLFFDLKGSTEWGQRTDPEEVMLTLNQLMADLAGVLERHGAAVSAYLGDGFLAYLTEADHALRGVRAALDLLAAVKEFNRPRRVLGLHPLAVRIGINSGQVYLGNVGTYQKMDYTVIGATVNQAARLQGEAEDDWPCVGRGTHDLVRHAFTFAADKPRPVTLKGIGVCESWDVTGPKTA